jgi:hypothetical protein
VGLIRDWLVVGEEEGEREKVGKWTEEGGTEKWVWRWGLVGRILRKREIYCCCFEWLSLLRCLGG